MGIDTRRFALLHVGFSRSFIQLGQSIAGIRLHMTQDILQAYARVIAYTGKRIFHALTRPMRLVCLPSFDPLPFSHVQAAPFHVSPHSHQAM